MSSAESKTHVIHGPIGASASSTWGGVHGVDGACWDLCWERPMTGIPSMITQRARTSTDSSTANHPGASR